MGVSHELGLPRPVLDAAHDALLGLLVTAAMITKEGDRVTRGFGITASQLNVLMLLEYQSDHGELDQSTLGRMLVVNRSNVTGLVDRMERDGLVARVADPGDRRVRLVRLTDRGRRVLAAAEPAYLARVREVMAGLGEAELAGLAKVTERLRGRLGR